CFGRRWTPRNRVKRPPRPMHRLNRLLLYALIATGLARAIFYFLYAASMLPLPLESHNLEAKMVLLAYRARLGLRLYPSWREYPYVSTGSGPVTWLCVGLRGRLGRADTRGLFLIGRGVSFASSILATLVVGAVAGRRYGQPAGLAAAILSLGSGPMFGFTVM